MSKMGELHQDIVEAIDDGQLTIAQISEKFMVSIAEVELVAKDYAEFLANQEVQMNCTYNDRWYSDIDLEN